jgi:hypothetical protein
MAFGNQGRSGDGSPVRPGPKNPPPRIRDRSYLIQPKREAGEPPRPGSRVVPPNRAKPKPQSANAAERRHITRPNTAMSGAGDWTEDDEARSAEMYERFLATHGAQTSHPQPEETNYSGERGQRMGGWAARGGIDYGRPDEELTPEELRASIRQSATAAEAGQSWLGNRGYDIGGGNRRMLGEDYDSMTDDERARYDTELEERVARSRALHGDPWGQELTPEETRRELEADVSDQYPQPPETAYGNQWGQARWQERYRMAGVDPTAELDESQQADLERRLVEARREQDRRMWGDELLETYGGAPQMTGGEIPPRRATSIDPETGELNYENEDPQITIRRAQGEAPIREADIEDSVDFGNDPDVVAARNMWGRIRVGQPGDEGLGANGPLPPLSDRPIRGLDAEPETPEQAAERRQMELEIGRARGQRGPREAPSAARRFGVIPPPLGGGTRMDPGQQVPQLGGFSQTRRRDLGGYQGARPLPELGGFGGQRNAVPPLGGIGSVAQIPGIINAVMTQPGMARASMGARRERVMEALTAAGIAPMVAQRAVEREFPTGGGDFLTRGLGNVGRGVQQVLPKGDDAVKIAVLTAAAAAAAGGRALTGGGLGA